MNGNARGPGSRFGSAPGRRGRWLTLALVAVAACLSDSTEPGAGPVSAANSEVNLSRALVVSGTLAEITLESRDAAGTRLRTGGHTVVFGSSGGSSEGVFGPVRDQGDGTYTGTFTGTRAGSPATITATIDGDPVTRPLPTIQVVPGPVSPTTSVIDVSPRTVTNGGQATLTLETRDAAGNLLGIGGKQVVFVPFGGTATGTVGPVTDHGDGSYTAVFTATGVGTALTIGGAVDGIAVSTPLPKLNVAFGVSPDSSTLSASSDTVSVNEGVTLRLQVRDSAGVARTSGGETVVFLVLSGPGSGGGTIDSTTDQGDGTYTAGFTATQSGGPLTIGATLNGQMVGGSQPTITILGIPVAPQKSSITVSADSITAGASATLTLTVRDLDSNQTAAGAGQSVVFSVGENGTSGGTIGPVTDQGDGSYTALFTGTLARPPAVVGAVINDSTRIQMLDTLGVSHLPLITVIPGPAAPDSSLLSVLPEQVDLGDSSLIRLDTRDGFGNPLGQGGLAVTFRRSNAIGASVGRISPVMDQGDGSYSAFYVADTAGIPDTIRASVGGLPVTTVRPTIQVVCTPGPVDLTTSGLTVNDTTPAQSPSRQVTLQSGVTTTITLRTRDSRSCPVTAPHIVVFGTTGGTSTGVLGSTVDQGDGTYTATFTGVLAGAPLTVQATVDAAPVTSIPATITVIPGDISAQTSLISLSRATLDSGAHALATLQARDAAGNALTSGGRAIIFGVSGPTIHGTVGPAADPGNGTYSTLYTALSLGIGVPDSVTAVIEGTPVQTTPPTVEVVAGTISPGQSVVSVGAATVTAGDSVLVTLTGKDAAGRALVTGDRAVPIGFTQAGGSTGAFGPLQNPDNGSYMAWFRGQTAAGPATIGAQIGGLPVTTALPTITVVAGPASVAASIVSTLADSLGIGDTTTVELQVLDAHGNPVNDAGLTITFTVVPGTTGSTGPAGYVSGNRYAATFTAASAGTASISAAINGVPLTTPPATILIQ